VDTIDVAQRRQQEEIDHALAARVSRTENGRTHCANADCGEPIASVRQQMGAQLCIDCQRAVERGAQSCARGAV
jgi:RNA polymerase-binding transcription factor DksA